MKPPKHSALSRPVRPSVALVAALALLAQACSLIWGAPTASPIPPTVSLPPAPTATPAPTGNGTITGKLGYPAESIPAMTLYFENVDTADALTLSSRDNQTTYSKSLPPGNYYVYAWLPDFGLGGSYSAAVPCGLTVDCTDHSMLPVEVSPGVETAGIDVLDWYGPPGSVPLPAGVSLGTGAIEGALHFPSEGIPALVVYARNVATAETFAIATAESQQTFTLSDLPPGVYHVFAWVSGGAGLGGAYTQAVRCGLSTECTDHSLIAVPVPAGRTTTGIDIADWYDQSVVPLP